MYAKQVERREISLPALYFSVPAPIPKKALNQGRGEFCGAPYLLLNRLKTSQNAKEPIEAWW